MTILTAAEFDSLVKKRKVTKKEKNNLELFKYSRNTFFNNDFKDSSILECRGIILNKESKEIATLPFKKLFNYQEKGAPELEMDREVIAVEKINGFMLAVSSYKGEIIYSTTGSLENKYIDIGKSFIDPDFKPEEYLTYLFEICHKDDPHIIKQEEGAYLIGVRNKHDGSLLPEEMLHYYANKSLFSLTGKGFKRVKFFKTTFGQILKESLENCNHEGFIIRDAITQEPLLKLKSTFYKFRKILARSKDSSCFNKIEILIKDREDLKLLFEKVKSVKHEFFQLKEQLRLFFLDTGILPKINYSGNLWLIRGLPSSGKSSVAQELLNLPGAVHFEADMFFYKDRSYLYDRAKIGEAHRWCQVQVTKAISENCSNIIVSNTLTAESEFNFYHNLAAKNNYKIISLITERYHSNLNNHNVPQETIDKMKERFQTKLF